MIERNTGAACVLYLAGYVLVVTDMGEWVRCSAPHPEGVCLPAFSPETVHRDE